MSTSVVACIDGSPLAKAVCDYANWAASALSAPLQLLHTIERQMSPAYLDYSGNLGMGGQQQLLEQIIAAEQEHSRLLIEQGELMLAAAKTQAEAAGIKEIEAVQRHDGLASTLVEHEQEIRLLVLGIRGESHQEQKTALGGQLESIIRSIHRPILVVNHEFSLPTQFMIAYDGSEAANKAVTMVATSPLLKNLPCHLVHVSRESKSQEQNEVLQRAIVQLEQAGLKVQAASLQGEVTDALCQYQEQESIDLTLMGAFSHTRLRDWFLGSFTEKMLTTTQKPLLLLR